MAQQERTFPTPLDADELCPGQYIKAADFRGGKPTLVIESVNLAELEGTTGKKVKGVIRFKGKDKGWVVNKTNVLCMVAMFGKKLATWVGKRVTLYAAPYEGDVAIRVWGSPDIEAEFVTTIQLPRKKPFKMTMHKVVPGAKPAANPTVPKLRTVDEMTAALRACTTQEQLAAEWQRIDEEHEAAGVAELSLDVEAAYNECRELIGGEIPF